MKNSLSNVVTTIEELASSSSEIHANQQNLSKNIKEITKLSESLNKTANTTI